MAKERGILREVFKNFVASLRPRITRARLVGEDYNGTKYFEDPDAQRRKGRSFEPKDKDNFEQEIPAEWEAWLRYRREDPPTEAEVKANYDLMMLKKKNAAELELQYTKGATVEMPKEKTGYQSFPVYEEYKEYGHGYREQMEEKRNKGNK